MMRVSVSTPITSTVSATPRADQRLRRSPGRRGSRSRRRRCRGGGAATRRASACTVQAHRRQDAVGRDGRDDDVVDVVGVDARPSSSARCAAIGREVGVACPGAAMRRSRMPVRLTIHSSDVSTIFSRSALDRTRSGTYTPGAGDGRAAHRSGRGIGSAGSRRGCARSRAARRTPRSCGSRSGWRAADALPWPMKHTPFTPSSGAAPYSSQSSSLLEPPNAGSMRAAPTFASSVALRLSSRTWCAICPPRSRRA